MLCWILFDHIFSGFLSPFFFPMTLSSWKVQVSCLVQCSIFVCLLSLGIIKFDSLVPMFPINSKLGLETWWVQVKFFLEILYHRWCWLLRISLYQETWCLNLLGSFVKEVMPDIFAVSPSLPSWVYSKKITWKVTWIVTLLFWSFSKLELVILVHGMLINVLTVTNSHCVFLSFSTD